MQQNTFRLVLLPYLGVKYLRLVDEARFDEFSLEDKVIK